MGPDPALDLLPLTTGVKQFGCDLYDTIRFDHVADQLLGPSVPRHFGEKPWEARRLESVARELPFDRLDRPALILAQRGSGARRKDSIALRRDRAVRDER